MSAQTTKKKIRSNQLQLRIMADYMSTHTSFANGEFSGPMGSKQNAEQWEKLRAMLGEHGPDKTVKQWIHTWRDLKKKAREEGAKLKKAVNATGNHMPVPKISEISESILGTIGAEMAFGIGRAEETSIGRFQTQRESLPGHSPNPMPKTTPQRTLTMGADMGYGIARSEVAGLRHYQTQREYLPGHSRNPMPKTTPQRTLTVGAEMAYGMAEDEETGIGRYETQRESLPGHSPNPMPKTTPQRTLTMGADMGYGIARSEVAGLRHYQTQRESLPGHSRNPMPKTTPQRTLTVGAEMAYGMAEDEETGIGRYETQEEDVLIIPDELPYVPIKNAFNPFCRERLTNRHKKKEDIPIIPDEPDHRDHTYVPKPSAANQTQEEDVWSSGSQEQPYVSMNEPQVEDVLTLPWSSGSHELPNVPTHTTQRKESLPALPEHSREPTSTQRNITQNFLAPQLSRVQKRQQRRVPLGERASEFLEAEEKTTNVLKDILNTLIEANQHNRFKRREKLRQARLARKYL